MSFTDPQKNWLDSLLSVEIDSWRTTESQREELVDDVQAEVTALRDRLHASFHNTLIKRKPHYVMNLFSWGEDVEQLLTVRGDGNLQQELDMQSSQEMSGVDTLSIEEHSQLILAKDEIDNLAERMRSATDQDGNPIFSAEDIMNELYTPLVNARIMSDQQVPADYSLIHQTFENAAGLYNQQLKSLAKPKGSEDQLRDSIKKTTEYISLATELALPFADLCGSSQAESLGKAMALATTAVKLVETVKTETRWWEKGSKQSMDIICYTLSLVYGDVGDQLKSAIEGSSQMLSARNNYAAGNYQAACTDLGAALKSSTDAVEMIPQYKASTLAAAQLFSSSDTYDTIRQAHHDGRPDIIAATLADVGLEARKIYLTSLKHEPENDEELTEEQMAHNKKVDAQIKTAHSYAEVAHGPKAVKEGVTELRKALKSGNPKAFLSSLLTMGAAAAKKTLEALQVSEDDDRELSEEDKTWNEQLEFYIKSVTDFEAVSSFTSELTDVGQGIQAYRRNKDKNALVAAIRKFGKESTSIYIERLKHPVPEEYEEPLSDDKQQENDNLDAILKLVDGPLAFIQGTVQVSEGGKNNSGLEVAAGRGEALGGTVSSIAGGLGMASDGPEMAMNIASGNLQMFLATVQGNNPEALTQLSSVLENLEAGKELLLDAYEEETDKEAFEAAKAQSLVEEELQSSLKNAFDIPSPTAETLKKTEEELLEIESQGLAARLLAEEDAFRNELELSMGGGDPDQDLRTKHAIAASFDIDTLIAKLERDKIVIDAALQITDTLTSLGKNIVPGLKSIAALKGLMVSVSEAIVRRKQYYKFLDSLQTAEASSSPYAPAIKRRVEDALEQYTDAQLNNIINICNVYGSLVGGVVGAIEQACVTLSGSNERGASYSDAEKGTAWKAYQDALKEPQNRKLKQRALAINPTLGKYALAYGAEKGDPIARDFMKKCGLNEQTMASPSTNVDKVVKYLGLYLNEELVLLDVELPQQWAIGLEAALRSSSWTTVTQRAIKDAGLKNSGDEQIVRVLFEIEDHDYHNSDAPVQHVIENYRSILQRFIEGINNYSPVNVRSNEPHADMIDIAQRFKRCAEQELQSAQL